MCIFFFLKVQSVFCDTFDKRLVEKRLDIAGIQYIDVENHVGF